MSTMTSINEDLSICARCNGQCCRTKPGIEGPERFSAASDPAAALAELLASGRWVLEKHIGIPYQPGVTEPDPDRIICYPRPATVAESLRPGIDPLPETGECVFLEIDGCILAFEQRPRLCRELIPDVCFECESPWGRREAAMAWLPHQQIIEQAVKKLVQLSATSLTAKG